LPSAQTIVGNGRPYTLQISNVKILDRHRTNVVLTFDVFNAGKEDIDLPYNTPLSAVDITFEDSLKNTKYAYFEHLIKEQIVAEELFLPVGLVKTDFKIEIFVAENGKKQQKTSNKNKERILPKKPIDIVKKDTIISQNIDSQLVIKDTLLLTKIDTTTLLPKKDSLQKIIMLDNALCKQPDFVVDSIYLLKKDKKSVTVNFLVKNIGLNAAFLLGATPSLEDNFAIKAYFSLLPKKTNGAIFARGLYIEKEAENTDNALAKNQSIWITMTVPLKTKSKFTPYLVIEANGNNNIEECTTDNNFNALKLPD
jgi:hypothetical protein